MGIRGIMNLHERLMLYYHSRNKMTNLMRSKVISDKPAIKKGGR